MIETRCTFFIHFKDLLIRLVVHQDSMTQSSSLHTFLLQCVYRGLATPVMMILNICRLVGWKFSICLHSYCQTKAHWFWQIIQPAKSACESTFSAAEVLTIYDLVNSWVIFLIAGSSLGSYTNLMCFFFFWFVALFAASLTA